LKIASLIILIVAIALSYLAPTVYEAYIEHKLNKITQRIMGDMLVARKQAIKTGNPTGLVFNVAENSYTVLDNDKEVKKVVLNDITGSIVFYKGLFTDGISLADNKIIFNKDGVCDIHINSQDVKNSDSIFLIHKRDEAKNILERIVRIYINKDDCSIVSFKVKSVTPSGELVFGD
jgi:hypothetical protein